MCNAHSSAWQTLSCQLFSFTSLCLRTKSLPSLSIFCFFWAVSRRYGSCQFGFTRLFLSFRVTLRQIVFDLPARFFSVSRSFQEDLSAFLARVSSTAVSSEFLLQFRFLDARNRTCLQPLPNALYANYYGIKDRSFWSV